MTTPQLSMAEVMTTEEVNRDNARILDAIVQSGVQRKDLTVPPAHVNGNCWIVAAGATDEWATKDGKIAQSYNGLWYFLTPKEGWTFWVNNENKYYVYDGSAWISNAGGVGGAFKNKIIGGNFDTNPWQRGTSLSMTVSNNWELIADRWRTALTMVGGAAATISKVSDAPTVAECGFHVTNCLSYQVTTVGTAPSGDVWSGFYQQVEGYNFAPLAHRSFTLSFWHKHTTVGKYSVTFINSGSDRTYIASYTQEETNIWEKATITVPAYPIASGGSWNYTTGTGISIAFLISGVNSNSPYSSSTENTWLVGNRSAGNPASVNNHVSGAYFKIALVQLEAGSAATDFEFRDVGTELVLCQRYFQIATADYVYSIIGSSSNTMVQACIKFPVEMRANPSFTYVDNLGLTDGTSGINQIGHTSNSNGTINTKGMVLAQLANFPASIVQYRPYQLNTATVAQVSAEL